jgi:hypothetical protein
MKSKITNEIRENFWIRCYLNGNNNYFERTADRAYRDLNRTIHGVGKIQTADKYERIRKVVIEQVKRLLNPVKDREAFNELHNEVCQTIIEAFEKIYPNISFHYGQSQKWANMTIKYLVALGENRIPKVTNNYMWYHVPIDNIIRASFKEKYDISHINIAWSKLNQEQYQEYQKQIVEKLKGEIPLDVEFTLFNDSESI